MIIQILCYIFLVLGGAGLLCYTADVIIWLYIMIKHGRIISVIMRCGTWMISFVVCLYVCNSLGCPTEFILPSAILLYIIYFVYLNNNIICPFFDIQERNIVNVLKRLKTFIQNR